MLTIRGTLQLNSLTPLKIGSDMLSRKILGNYQFMRTSVTAQDLLHMTMLPTEVYVQEAGGSNVSLQQDVTVENKQRLELINHFFNRILLLNTQDFTYQDEVFISRFLRKTGITDTAEFVSQVQKLIRQNVHITSLMEHYWTAGAKIHSLAVQLSELSKKPLPETEAEAKEKAKETPAPEVRCFLQQEIFKRLHTSFLNNFIYDTRKYVAQGQIHAQEAVLCEQIQMADTIRLAELKQLVLMEEQPPVHSQFRFYEQIPIRREQMNEKTVMKYLGASVLTNFISQISYFLLEKQENKPVHWADYHRAFYGSSENTLKRFLEFHGEQYRNYRKDSYMEAVNHLYEKEENILELFCLYQSRQTREIYPACQMVHALLELQNQEKQAEELLYQNTLPPVREPDTGLPGERPPRDVLTVLIEAEQRLKTQGEQLPYLFYSQSGRLLKETETYQERKIPEEEAVLETVLPPEQHTPLNTYRETVKNQFFTEADYKRYLDEINEKNIYKQTLLNNSRTEKQTPRTIAVDRKTAIRKSLEAFQEPEKVLKQMLSDGQPIENRTDPEIERLLALAEEPVRKLYRQILYQEEAGKAGKQEAGAVREEAVGPAAEFQMVSAEPEQLREILREAESSVLTAAVFRTSEAERVPGRERTESREETPVLRPKGEERMEHPADPAQRGGSLESGDEAAARQDRLVREIRMITRESRRAVSNLVWQPPKPGQAETTPLQYRPDFPVYTEEAERSEPGRKPLPQPLTGRTEAEKITGQEASDILRKAQANVRAKTEETSQTAVFTKREPSPVNLVFKREQAPVEEEIIEQMTKNSRVINRQQENTTEIIKNSTVIQEKLQETRQEILVENRKNITELIQRSLQTQMGAISDQVYQNLERRLFHERKRRGY